MSDYGAHGDRFANKTHSISAAGGDGRWGVPSGRVPTTHILKPPIANFAGHVENEHFCMRLSAAAGLPTAESAVTSFNGERAIVVTRYDRQHHRNRGLVRVHQEDMCQALKVHPGRKYQNEGGPGIAAIMNVLNSSSRPDIDRARFMEAMAFNFVIGGTDAHGKNFSVFLGNRGSVRLAPLYDVASILPYDFDERKLRMPMKVGTHYELDGILPRHWEMTAKASSYSGDAAVGHVRRLISILPDLASELATKCRDDGLTHPVVDKLANSIATRAAALQQFYGAEASSTIEMPAAAKPADEDPDQEPMATASAHP
jgi:serine/threonine-protein kinase HipA